MLHSPFLILCKDVSNVIVDLAEIVVFLYPVKFTVSSLNFHTIVSRLVLPCCVPTMVQQGDTFLVCAHLVSRHNSQPLRYPTERDEL